jgi:hypothetical protein
MYNKTCHVTSIPLRSIAAGKMSYYNSISFRNWQLSVQHPMLEL